ncbi:MAG TPA: hypothetical protein VFG01_10545 [Acidobacteriota bacterium]|nr:hypothetical protein [Acidobacteriota bacterium]
MRLKSMFVFSLLVFFLFALTVCGTKEEMVAEEEAPVVEAPAKEEAEMTKEELLMAKMIFSKEAEKYIDEEMKKEKWEIRPQEKLAACLNKLKADLEKDTGKAGEILKQLGAQMEDDSEVMTSISGEEISKFFKEYGDRNLVFEIQHVFVNKISEKKYAMEVTDENEIDMKAYVIFRLHLIQKEGVTNDTFDGFFACPHRNVCSWFEY